LVDRVYGIRELLETLDARPMAYGDLRAALAAQGVSWDNAMAVRYRIWWLIAARALTAKRVGRSDLLSVTSAGRACVRVR
jgi:hypothetical protein